jgi:pyrimidine-nucleoside phosphorylase
MHDASMHVPGLIERKREGDRLTAGEIHALIQGYTRGDIPDYQMSAWAMAVFFQGLTDEETAALTAAMRDSGRVFSYPSGTPPKVDKHSTGGIGDKVSLVLAPLLACEELWVPMVSGRGLGITGGTLDKMEAIPGFRVALEESECLRQLEKLGVFMAGQTADFCPADKKLYALRDVTGTVPSQPLIVASIMSKKLAESLDRLVLDVKFGSGAFMKTEPEARQLAERLAAVGLANGVETEFLMTPMHEPLGHTVGNALEVAESVDALLGRGPEDLVRLTLDLACRVCSASNERLMEHLSSGRAFQKFVSMVEAQGGDATALERMRVVHSAAVEMELVANSSGVLRGMDAGVLGRVAVGLGAGRRIASDAVDPAVGLSGIRKVGESVMVGEPLLRVHAKSDADAHHALQVLQTAVEIR